MKQYLSSARARSKHCRRHCCWCILSTVIVAQTSGQMSEESLCCLLLLMEAHSVVTLGSMCHPPIKVPLGHTLSDREFLLACAGHLQALKELTADEDMLSICQVFVFTVC